VRALAQLDVVNQLLAFVVCLLVFDLLVWLTLYASMLRVKREDFSSLAVLRLAIRRDIPV
jgi:hypothetical protein